MEIVDFWEGFLDFVGLELKLNLKIAKLTEEYNARGPLMIHQVLQFAMARPVQVIEMGTSVY
jgi:hypothetical protein